MTALFGHRSTRFAAAIAITAGGAALLVGLCAAPALALTTPGPITITSTPPSPAYVGSTYALTATGGGSTAPVVFSSGSPSTCSVADHGDGTGTATFVGFGTCLIDANQAADGTYAAADQVVQNVPVTAQDTQTITFTSKAPTHAVTGGSYHVTATNDGSTNPVVFSSASPSKCTDSGSTVTFKAIGTCTVLAQVAGTAEYSAGYATQRIRVYRITEKPTLSARSPKTGRLTVTVTSKPSLAGLKVTVYSQVGKKDHKLGTVKTSSKGVATFKAKETSGKKLHVFAKLAISARSNAAKTKVHAVKIK